MRHLRKKHGVMPVYKRVDTCAAEFESFTPYLYSTYEDEDEAAPTDKKKVIILGSGPNRIGQGIEFDYCCCHAVVCAARRRLRDDHGQLQSRDRLDRLRHQRSPLLRAADLRRRDGRSTSMKLQRGADVGVIVQFGGQTPLNLALPLKAGGREHHRHVAGVDRSRRRSQAFRQAARRTRYPASRPAAWPRRSKKQSQARERIGYPVLVRPSYVLGGRAMVIAYDDETVVRYMNEAVEYSQDRPVLIDHFLEDAIEVDVDALSDGEDVVIGGIMQHIEEAGIHSGDSSCVLPAVDIPEHLLKRMREYTFKLARALKVVGLMNIQFAIPRNGRSATDARRQSLRARSEPARLAHRAVCFQGHRRSAWRRLPRA